MEALLICGVCARPLRQGSHATAARLGQRGWPPERVPATALAKLLPRPATTRLNLGGRGAPKNEVALFATSGINLCGYGSGARFAGSERFAQRPEGGPPQGAVAASCPISARVSTRGGPRAIPRGRNASVPRSGTEMYLSIPVLYLRSPDQIRTTSTLPYLARQRCRGRRRSPREHLWGRSPFVCPAGAESAQRADRGEHTGGLPRFGPRRTRKTLILLWFVLLWGARELQELAAPSV